MSFMKLSYFRKKQEPIAATELIVDREERYRDRWIGVGQASVSRG